MRHSLLVRVQCYSGHKAGERPLRFELGGRWLDVLEVEDRWYSPDAMFFRVRASDSGIYILRHSESDDAWALESYRRGGSS